MRQFINGSPASWDNLEQRARRACVVFADTDLPPGCTPATARIGFEIGPSGVATLYVDRGVSYDGSSSSVRTWLDAGEMRFTSMTRLREWVRAELSPLFAHSNGAGPAAATSGPARAHPPGAGRPPVLLPDQLTDLDAVRATADAHLPALMSEDVLFGELSTRVYGQDDALRVVARRIARHVRRSHPRRPATLFAVGPTGVGKTRTAQALAESLGTLLDGRWSSLVRLNMNEYSERHRVSQLLGAPPSYIGYGDGTVLIDRLVAQPESVVLFDEIEKAHPDILVTLMSAMDAGELSSPAPAAHGRAVDCRRAVFFFTSNIDVREAMAELDQAANPAESADVTCRRHLTASGIKSELIGRIGAFLVFRPLSERARAEIATAAVARVAAEYGLTVVRVAPEIISDIVGRPYGNFGARPDEYYIDDMLGPEFARYAAECGEASVCVEARPEPTCVAATI